MTVYIVMEKVEYESNTIVAVCSTEEKAEKIREKKQNNVNCWDIKYIIDEWDVDDWDDN